MTLKDWCIQNQRIDILKEWDYELNKNINIETVPVSSRQKAWWKCELQHSYQAVINDRTKRNTKCPVCAHKKVLKGFNDLLTYNRKLAQQWHSTKNGHLKPDMVTPQSNKKVWWQCSKGHEWQTTISDRTRGTGCPYCSGRKVLKGYNDIATTHPHVAQQWHKTKNHPLTAQEVTSGSNKKVWWQCEYGHEWEALISSRCSSGRNCPVCAKSAQTSFPENAIFFYVQQIYPDAIKSYSSNWLKPMSLDIFIPSLQIGIEYDGEMWHKNISNDQHKNLLCKQHGINLIRIREPKCPQIDGQCIILESKHIFSIERAIQTLLDKFLPCDCQLSVNIAQDIVKINDIESHRKQKYSLLSCNPTLAKQWHPTKNGKLRPEQVSIKSNKRVWWLCDKGHEWMDTCAHRSSGRNCPYCSNKKVLIGFNDMASTNPELISQLHPTKNGDFKPTDIVVGSQKRLWWLCDKCGYEWQTSPQSRVQRTMCPKCAIRHTIENRKAQFKTERMGQHKQMKSGLWVTITEYNNTDDITLQFDDGTIVCHKTYTDFKNGKITYPKHQLK